MQASYATACAGFVQTIRFKRSSFPSSSPDFSLDQIRALCDQSSACNKAVAALSASALCDTHSEMAELSATCAFTRNTCQANFFDMTVKCSGTIDWTNDVTEDEVTYLCDNSHVCGAAVSKVAATCPEPSGTDRFAVTQRSVDDFRRFGTMCARYRACKSRGFMASIGSHSHDCYEEAIAGERLEVMRQMMRRKEIKASKIACAVFLAVLLAGAIAFCWWRTRRSRRTGELPVALIAKD